MAVTFSIVCLIAWACIVKADSTFGGVENGLPELGAAMGRPDLLASLTPLLQSSSGGRKDGDQPSVDIETACQAYIDVFSEAAANYTHCALTYSRPLRFCEHCSSEYLYAKSVYQVIMSGKIRIDNDSLCKDLILKSDRIQIVVRVNDFITDLWDDCHCDSCFEDGTPGAGLSNDTLYFLDLADQTHDCFRNMSHSVWPYKTHTSEFNITVCDNCSSIYKKMNDFYVKIQHNVSDGLCMDIVDIMNSTRQVWSGTFNCSQTPGSMLPVLVISSFFAMLPVIFYASNRIHGARKERHLMRQRRLRLPSTSGNGQQASSTRDDPSSGEGGHIGINNSLHQDASD